MGHQSISIPGFSRIADRRGILLVREDYATPLAKLGLLDGTPLPTGAPDTRFIGGRGCPLVVPLEGAGDERVVIREYHHGGALRWFSRTLFLDRERSLRELALLEKFSHWRVPTLKGVAALSRRVFPGIYRLALVTVEERDAQDLLHFLATEKSDLIRRRVLTEAGRVVRRMHAHNVAHADLHPRNILVTAGAEPRVLIIDLDQSREVAGLSQAARVRALARLERFLRKLNMREGLVLGRRDRMRFLKGYFGRLDRPARADLAMVSKRLARHLPWHRGLWALGAIFSGKRRSGQSDLSGAC